MPWPHATKTSQFGIHQPPPHVGYPILPSDLSGIRVSVSVRISVTASVRVRVWASVSVSAISS